jgi:hypothetical protein
MLLAAGSKLGPYEILAPISARVMGEVYGLAFLRAEHMRAGNSRPAGSANGCIQKLSADHLPTKIEVFAKVIHRMDVTTTAAEASKETLTNAVKQSKGKLR